jgi:hypothetical protein
MEWNDNFVAAVNGSLFCSVAGQFTVVPKIMLQVNAVDFAFEFPVKLFATAILALVGGVLGVLGKDLYADYIRPRLVKRKLLKPKQ